MEHQAVYERLVQAARAGEFVHHGELARMFGIARNRLAPCVLHIKRDGLPMSVGREMPRSRRKATSA